GCSSSVATDQADCHRRNRREKERHGGREAATKLQNPGETEIGSRKGRF
ncbi:hypothetical protein CCACVL1_06972, partial [Corchorus capsularis]